MKEFITAVEEAVEEAGGTPVDEQCVEFKMSHFEGKGEKRKKVSRVLKAYPLTEGQLTFMLAALGRGQESSQRFASIINVMMASLRDPGDADYFEGRLLSPDPDYRLKVEEVEEIFEWLSEEWFARPTQPQSDSAESQ